MFSGAILTNVKQRRQLAFGPNIVDLLQLIAWKEGFREQVHSIEQVRRHLLLSFQKLIHTKA